MNLLEWIQISNVVDVRCLQEVVAQEQTDAVISQKTFLPLNVLAFVVDQATRTLPLRVQLLIAVEVVWLLVG